MKKILSIAFAVMAATVMAEGSGVTNDKRPIVMLDEKDVLDKTGYGGASGLSQSASNSRRRNLNEAIGSETDPFRVSPRRILERIQNAVSDTGIFRVIDKHSIGRGLQEESVFSALADDQNAAVSLKVPAYRIAVSVLRYDVCAGEMRKKHERFGHQDYADVYDLKAQVELSVSIIDMKTQETILKKKYHEVQSSPEGDTSLRAKYTGYKNANDERQPTPPTVVDARRACVNADERFQDLLKQVADRFAKDLANVTGFPVLACSDEGEVSVDMPADIVKVGTRLVLVTTESGRKSKRTGKAARVEKVVAKLVVKRVAEDSVLAEFSDILNVEAPWKDVRVKFDSEE